MFSEYFKYWSDSVLDSLFDMQFFGFFCLSFAALICWYDIMVQIIDKGN